MFNKQIRNPATQQAGPPVVWRESTSAIVVHHPEAKYFNVV